MNKKSCLIGCSAVLIVFLLIVGGVGVYLYNLYSHVRSYTAASPVEIPVYKPTAEESAEVDQKSKLLKDAIDTDKKVEVSFTGDDINTIIATNPKFKTLSGKVHFTIKDDELSCKGSIPLTEVPFFSDRYFNGKLSLNATMKNGRVWVTAKSAEVNGKPVPDADMKQFQNQNLAENMYKDPEQAKFIRKFERIEVEDGKVIIKTKGTKGTASSTESRE